MNWRLLWRLSLVVLVGLPLIASTGCSRWRYRDKDRDLEIEVDHDYDHDHHPGNPHHPHGGPPGQMKKHKH